MISQAHRPRRARTGERRAASADRGALRPRAERQRTPFHHLIVGVFLCIASSAAAESKLPADNWCMVPLPGGLVELQRLLGPSLERGMLFVEAARRLETGGPKQDALRSALGRYLDTPLPASDGRQAVEKSATAQVPLPLTPEIWTAAVFNAHVDIASLGAAILHDRDALLLAHGLAALDPETLAWIGGRPKLLRRIYRNHAGAFAAFGRSVRIAGDRIVPAGGQAASNRWEQLIGSPVSEPERFVESLLARDKGRAAWFYDAVAHLDDRHARQALGLWLSDDRAGRQRAAAMARVFAEIDSPWSVERWPFQRPRLDPALFLAELETTPTGELALAVSRRLWEKSFEGLEARSAGAFREVDTSGPADAAWLAARIFFADEFVARSRYEMVLFADRIFRGVIPTNASDTVTTLRGFEAFPALMLTLERAGMTSPELCAAAARRAASISAVADTSRRARLLAQFQGAVVLVERARFAGSLDVDTARALIAALVDVRIDSDAEYAGGVARWLSGEFLPALPDPGDIGGSEKRVRAGLAGLGAVSPAGRLPTIQWEGMPYRVDLANAAMRKLERVRETQGGYTLDIVLSVARAGVALTAPRDLEAVRGVQRQLDALSSQLAGLNASRESSGTEPDVAGAISRESAQLSHIETERDLRHARRSGAALTRLGDVMLADTLAAFAYATAIAPSDDPGLRALSIVRRHAFEGVISDGASRRRQQWSVPKPEFGSSAGWHLCGSLLAIDVATADTRLYQVESDHQPPPPMVDDVVRQVLAQHVVLLDPRQLDDGARDAIADALVRGRARANRLAANGESLEDVARAAGLSEWRREALRRSIVSDPESVPSAFSLTELFRLGLDVQETRDFSAWGLSAQSLTGSLRPRLPPARSWEELAGHRATGLLATEFLDLTLRIADVLSEARLPAALVPAVLAAATWEMAAEARTASPDDWAGLVEYVRHLKPARVADYLATLTGDGPLTALQPAQEGRF
jgi:hypothetical protein